MSDTVLLGIGSWMIPLPRPIWHRAIKGAARQTRASLAFMSDDHHLVRDFVVSELPRARAPIAPQTSASRLDLDLDRVTRILGELEKRLTFLFRNPAGEVTWAYPVTVDETAHRGVFSTGEEAFSP